MAIISKSYAKKLIGQGKAEYVGTMCDEHNGITQMFWVINRFDLGRTDHAQSSVALS